MGEGPDGDQAEGGDVGTDPSASNRRFPWNMEPDTSNTRPGGDGHTRQMSLPPDTESWGGAGLLELALPVLFRR